MSTIFDVNEQVLLFDNTEHLKATLDKMDRKNIVPSFKKTKDPINLIFDHIDSKPLNTLAKEFVKETFLEAVSFISKAFEA